MYVYMYISLRSLTLWKGTRKYAFWKAHSGSYVERMESNEAKWGEQAEWLGV